MLMEKALEMEVTLDLECCQGNQAPRGGNFRIDA